MAYGPKGRIQPRKKPKKAAKAGASKVTTGGGAGRAIGSGLSKRVGKGAAGKAGKQVGGARKLTAKIPTKDMIGGKAKYPGKWTPVGSGPVKPRRKPPARRRGR